MHAASLNHVYRLVWSERLMGWVPVPERASARGKAGRGGARARAAAVALGVLGLLASVEAGANGLPSGGQIVQGSGSIGVVGNTMTVTQDTARMVANWQGFNIGAGQTVRFVQPSASAVALNRVLGGDVSVIQGALRANGQVFLLNPNGVLFSPTAQVDTAGLLASTLAMSDTDFMAARHRLQGDSTAAVVNEGQIQVRQQGGLALVAATVRNVGTLQADGGFVGLASGQDVTVDFGGAVKLQVHQGAIDSLIENGGAVRADGGRIFFTAKAADELSRSVINQTGVVRARTLASGAQGEILLIGDMVHGELNAGGTLDASAPVGGAGGFIETSAAHVTTLDGLTVTAQAASGMGGKWLIDPFDYVINATAAANIVAALNTGTSVTVTTQTSQAAYGGGASGSGDITVASAINKTAGGNATLELLADRNIIVNSAISSTSGTLGITLSAANNTASNLGGVAVNANLTSNGGRILIGGAGGNQTTAQSYGIGYALNSSSTSAAVQIGTNVAIRSGGAHITINGRSGATGSGTYSGTRGGIYVLSGATVDTGGGNLYMSGHSTAHDKVFGFGLEANSGTTTTFRTASSGGGIVVDARNSQDPLGSLGLTNNGSQARIQFWAPSVAHFLFRLNGSNQAAVFTRNPPCNANYPNCGTMVIPGGNQSYTSAGYNAVNMAMKPLYIFTGSGSRVYDGTTAATGLTYTHLGGPTGFAVNDLGTLTFATPTKHVGSYTALTPGAGNLGTYTSGGTDYAVAYFNEGVYSITPRTISAFTASNKVYDGTTAANITSTDIVSGDAVTVNATGGFASAGVGNGISVNVSAVALSGADAGNYTVAASGAISATANITPAPLTVRALSLTKTYDGLVFSGGNGVEYIGFVNGEDDAVLTGTLNYGGTSQGAVNAGSYTITAGGLSAANYALTFADGTLKIQPAMLSVIAGELVGTVSKVYDGTNVATLLPSHYRLTGWVGEDGATVTKTVGSYDNAHAGSSKTVTVSLSESDFTALGATILANYELPTTVSGNVGVITPATLTLTAAATHKTYDGTDTAFGSIGIVGLQGSDTVSDVVQRFADGQAGSGKTVSISGYTVNDGNSGGNYTVQLVGNAGGHIGRAAATVSAAGRSVTYNGATQSLLTPTLSGFLSGDDIVVSGLATGRNAGSYTSVLSVTGSAAENYDVTFTNAVLQILPATLTLTASAASKTYNGSDAASGSIGIVGLQGSDTVSDVVQRFADGQAGSGKMVSISGYTVNDGNNGGNYTVQLVGNTGGHIGRAAATVSAAGRSVTYNGATQSLLTPTLSGFLSGDDIVVSGLATGRNAGSYTSAFSVGGASAVNYDVTFTNAVLQILPATLTLAVAPVSRPAGTANPPFQATVSGFVGDDTLASATTGSLRFTTTAGAASQPGSYGVVVDGLTALYGNYVMAQAAGNAEALTVSAALPTAERFMPRAAAVPNFPDNAVPALGAGGQVGNGGNLNYVSVSSIGAAMPVLGNTADTAGPGVGSGNAVVPVASSSSGGAPARASGEERGVARAARPGVAGTRVPSANGPLDIFVVDGGINADMR
ncbi:filamentous hemagglutinin N-terminal domain-containing protein [Aquabacterium fontiphilum]|uniref:beta strand repeat-containing protein n=1 Tax=Aquabacterium fontiphilum TaxID=450365 RepID=UPI001377E5B5|nr:YDG domain-containing protein [Aquabacterium fontiphilum]NBD19343.1 filamentous hemagglutinin N-terminal domain-containing protein [Aquabacterium fontiphilum]